MWYIAAQYSVMKYIYLIAISFFCSIYCADAQERSSIIDGDQFVTRLADQRYHFNKSLIKHSPTKLPTPTLIFASAPSLSFDGHTYILKNNQIVEIKGFLLSKSALEAINNKLLTLDVFQKECAESSNGAYGKASRDLQFVKNKDRQYFASLKQILSITSTIAKQYQKPNASVTIEMAMNSIELPKVDRNDAEVQNMAIAKIK